MSSLNSIDLIGSLDQGTTSTRFILFNKNGRMISVSNKEHKPNWVHDDSLNLDNHVDDNSVDFIFSCPPYHDLEVYTDDDRDLSRMSYDKFMDNYRKIIHKCYSKLKDNRFAGFVITELRDPKTGGYKNFLLDYLLFFFLDRR